MDKKSKSKQVLSVLLSIFLELLFLALSVLFLLIAEDAGIAYYIFSAASFVLVILQIIKIIVTLSKKREKSDNDRRKV